MELPVTLIVKAPNQQIEDQTVQCELTWTINKLKQHLSEVYPSKPPKDEQKLIYSGKLLNDSVVLKDILRQYDDGDNTTHTVHLVCSPKYTEEVTVNNVYSSRSNQTTSTTATTSGQNVSTATGMTQENINQRVPNLQWFNPQMPQHLDPQTMQMIMMQQAAFMHYFSQYQYHMNIASQQYGLNVNLPHRHQAGTLHQQNQHQELVQEPEAANNGANNQVPAAVVREPDRELNRDFLDIFYMLSRIMIFISIVYFYSSPVRCLVVLILGLSLYLYQVGFFRNVNINNNNIVQGERAAQQDATVQAPTRLMVLWTFFTTFFASLLPEIPNVV